MVESVVVKPYSSSVEDGEYEELTIELKDLKPGDKVCGVDGQWYDAQILPVVTPSDMYGFEFETGSVECSGDHLWVLYKGESSFVREAREIYLNYEVYKDFEFGHPGGPRLVSARETDPKPARCLATEAPGHLFEVLTSEGAPVYTHNCQMRLVCGRLGSVASMMALGNTQATTIRGDRPGAGAISANGAIDTIQYYYAQHSWITEWFAKRGMDKFGYGPEDEESQVEDLSVSELQGTEELHIDDETMHIEFSGVKGVVDKSKNQKFEEV